MTLVTALVANDPDARPSSAHEVQARLSGIAGRFAGPFGPPVAPATGGGARRADRHPARRRRVPAARRRRTPLLVALGTAAVVAAAVLAVTLAARGRRIRFW